MTDNGMRTIEVQFNEGQLRRMTFPADWKVTFGAIVPSDKAASSGGYGGWGLRIYESATKQCAVFTGVQSFYDMSIDQKVEAIRKFGTKDWYANDGTWTGERADLVEAQWVDIDDVEAGKPPYHNELLPASDPDEETVWAPATLRGLARKPR